MTSVENWRKLFTEWRTPSLYLKVMFGYDKLPKQLDDLDGVQQSKEWHPEGDALVHTFCVVNAMADICEREGIVGEERFLFMLAALCHDFGKATTTKWNEEKKKWTAYGHDLAGVAPAKEFLEYIGYNGDVERILSLVRHHMVHCQNHISTKFVKKLFEKLKPATFRDLLLLMEADCRGRGAASSDIPLHVREAIMSAENALAA